MPETTAPSVTLFVDPQTGIIDRVPEDVEAKRLAKRYELEFVDLDHFNIDHALFRSIPADLMLRYGFVP